MLYRNGSAVLADFALHEVDVRVQKGKIMDIAPRGMLRDPEGAIDMAGKILAPGLIDMHIHGCAGVDFSSDGDTAACLRVMSEYLYRRGVAAFAPAVMTMPLAEMKAVLARYRSAAVNPFAGAAPVGVYLEGPFLSAAKCGAQPPDELLSPDAAIFRELWRCSGENIRVACVAPEREGAAAFIREAAKVCRVSAAHTAADYDTMREGIAAGITQATHLYNGMAAMTHREPNGVGALLESHAFCELICDGLHVHPAMVRLTYRLIDADRLCLISDAMAATGLGDGTFRLGNQEVTVRGKEARLSDGTLAGSVTDMLSAFENAVAFGIPPLDALKAATLNPARALGIDGVLGSIAVGKADWMILFDENFHYIGNSGEERKHESIGV